MEQDHYRVLGVDPKVAAREIKRAWLKLARKEHPDVNPGDREAAERFARLQEAWRILSNRGLREEYDRRGRTPAGGESRDRNHPPRPQRWEQVIREIFPEAAGPEQAMSAARGEDVHQVLELSFEEALRGVARELRYQREGPCPECRGRRFAPGAKVETCRSCGGRGVVEVPHGPWSVKKICPTCFGKGEAGTPPCATCRGRGHLLAVEKRAVRVPRGSASGGRILIAGAGHVGRRGGEPGDLVITLRVQPHPFLERKGQNLYCSVKVALPQAVLGGPVRVPTLEGRSTLRLPPGTQSGQEFILRGKGVPASEGGRRGDLYVTARVVIPSGDDPRVRAMFSEYGKLVPGPAEAGT